MSTPNYVRSLKSAAEDRRGKLDVALGVHSPDLKARNGIAAVYEGLDAATEALDMAALQIRSVGADGSRSPQFKTERITQLLAAVTTETTSGTQSASTALAALRARLASIALPQRPSDDMLSEARLQGLRMDVRMTLDPTPKEEIVGAMVSLLEHYIGRGDALGTWLLAGDSDFAALYFRSRLGSGADVAHHEYERRLPSVTDAIVPDAARNARRLLALIDGPEGLDRIVTLTKTAIGVELKELSTLADRSSTLIGAN